MRLQDFVAKKKKKENKTYNKNYNDGLNLAQQIYLEYNCDYEFARFKLINELDKANKEYNSGKTDGLNCVISFLRNKNKE